MELEKPIKEKETELNPKAKVLLATSVIPVTTLTTAAATPAVLPAVFNSIAATEAIGGAASAGVAFFGLFSLGSAYLRRKK